MGNADPNSLFYASKAAALLESCRRHALGWVALKPPPRVSAAPASPPRVSAALASPSRVSAAPVSPPRVSPALVSLPRVSLVAASVAL